MRTATCSTTRRGFFGGILATLLCTLSQLTLLQLTLSLASAAAAEPELSRPDNRPASQLTRFESSQPQMGVPWRIVVYATDKEAANIAISAAFKRIKQLNDILSDYEPESELSQLGLTSPQKSPVKLSADLFNVLAAAQQLSQRSAGAYDISVGPVVKLWRRARRQREMPDKEKLAEALAAVGYQSIKLDPENRTVQLLKPKMRLDAGGIGMGYAVDEAMKVLKEHGIASAMIDASGDVGVSDAPPGSAGWRIGIDTETATGPASRYVLLSNAAITTSGDAFQHVEINGVRYSHIADPRTGLGLTDQSAATVIAKDCTTADSLTKAVSVLGPVEGFKVVAQYPGAEALLVRIVKPKETSKKKTKLERFETPGFKKYVEGMPTLAPGE
ncbi:MAG: FAD:protein FMN transferase [Planctomycetota bacterium]|nr:FAD:protein FMN transferase [Planctomycetota bacterium]